MAENKRGIERIAGWYSLETILTCLKKNYIAAVLEPVSPKSRRDEALPLVNRGARLNESLCESCRRHGITQLPAVFISRSVLDVGKIDGLIEEACQKWERKKEEARRTAEEKAARLIGRALEVYRACQKLCSSFKPDEEIPQPGTVNRELAEELTALGKISAELMDITKEAIEDLLNGEGSILVKVRGITPPSQKEAKDALEFLFEALKLAESFNALHHRRGALFKSDVVLFEHQSMLELALAAFFANCAFWGGWIGADHEKRSADIYQLIRFYRPSLPTIEGLMRDHSRTEWIGCIYEAVGNGVVRPVDSNRVRNALCLALMEEFFGRTESGESAEAVLESMAARYMTPPSPFHDSSIHGSAGLPIYAYVLAALCNLHGILPKRAIVELSKDVWSGGNFGGLAKSVGLGGGVCGISMGGLLIWLFWVLKDDKFKILEKPDSSLAALTSLAPREGGYPKRVLIDLGSAVGGDVYREGRRWVIGFLDVATYSRLFGAIEQTLLPNLKAFLAERP